MQRQSQMRLPLLFAFFLLTTQLRGQTKECWTVLLHEKGNQVAVKPDMESFSKTGFYLYRNCVYEIETKAGNRYAGRLADIKPDSLFFTNFLNPQAAQKAGVTFDTLPLHYRQLDKLYLIADRSLGMYTKKSFDQLEFVFSKDSVHCAYASDWIPIYYEDSTQYEVVPHLTAQGITSLYESDSGSVYYYYGRMDKPTAWQVDTNYVKKAIGFIPAGQVDEITMLAFGFIAFPGNVNETLKVKGVCIEILSLGVFAPIFGSFLAKDAHFFASKPEPTDVWIYGFNISPGGAVDNRAVKGFYMGAGATMVNKLSGFSFSGIHTRIYEGNGVIVSGLRNQVKKGRGLQIALFNSSQDFKGVQVGLWNKIGKRSFPLINWNFREN